MKSGVKLEKRAERLLGFHLSIAGGIDHVIERAVSRGLTAIQVFLKNNNRWEGPPLEEKTAKGFLEKRRIHPIYVAGHAGYLINLAGKGEKHARSLEALKDDMERCDRLGIEELVVHPGSHLGDGRDKGIDRIITSLNRLNNYRDHNVRILLETMAGQGSSMGERFEDLAEIIEGSERKEKLGVCLDTAHIFAAGYDFRTENDLEHILEQFDTTVGLNRLKLIHINDSKREPGSRVDRHEHIGQGEIGLDGFRLFLNDTRLIHIPMIMETPREKDDDEYDRLNWSTLQELIATR
jgi:deoxyribonuclease-4